jgi:hypothetical protein
VLDRDPTLHRWVAHRWLSLACLDPEAPVLWPWELGAGGAPAMTRYRPEQAAPRSRGDSLAWYVGRRGHLPVARIVAEPSL